MEQNAARAEGLAKDTLDASSVGSNPEVSRDMTKPFAILPVLGLALASCGGSSAMFSPEFEVLVSESDRLGALIETAEQAPGLPFGFSDYSGVIVLADDLDTATRGTIGKVELFADFDLGTINGTGSGFFRTAVNSVGDPIGTGSPVAGSVVFAATDIDTLFVLDMTGDVFVDGAVRPVDGPLLGSFFGPNAELIAAFGEDIPAGAIDVDAALVAD